MFCARGGRTGVGGLRTWMMADATCVSYRSTCAAKVAFRRYVRAPNPAE